MPDRARNLATRWTLAAVAGAALVFTFRPSVGNQDLGAQPPPLPHVIVAPVAELGAVESVRFAGVTRGRQTSLASFTVGGRLEARPVEIGDVVRSGQAIANIDGREFRNSLATARGSLAEVESRLAQARRDVARSQALFARDAATAEEVEQSRAGQEALEAGRRAAAAQVDELTRLVAESTLRAPIAGTVSEVFLEPGEYAAPGRPVVAISGDDGVEVEIELPESMVLGLELGQEVRVEFPLAGLAPTSGRMTSVGRSTLGAGRLFPVIVRVDGEDVDSEDVDRSDNRGDGKLHAMPGLTAEVVIEHRLESGGSGGRGELGGRGRGLAVPVDAVLDPGGQAPYVFTVHAGIAHRRTVDVRRLVGEQAIVTGALAAGDEVVVSGQFALLDGDPVEVAPLGTGRISAHRAIASPEVAS